ncbi:glycosyltransferase [Cohnella fermenti]|uniref:Glycosyltransferase n=1 Tax=Cohnella fermenti TaxID=2565925 RepID=A0A4S4BZ65_9BACL|nr:glycosyltransferase [Cohnella fermenti]THF79877.1 glycosyltransferase [Cohnella fermenti]
MGTMAPLVSIIILTCNESDLTRECVRSIADHTPEDYELVFVDNGSTDGTVAYLRTIPDAKLILNRSNRGFAAGCNQGIVAASGTYICLLNNDTVVSDGWLTRMLAWFEKNPRIGIVGPRTNYAAGSQRVDAVPYRTMDEMREFAKEWAGEHAGDGFYPYRLIGFCMVMHRSLIDRVGGLDETFYPGTYEDDDLCLRARINGNILWVAQDVFIHHHGSRTFRSKQFREDADFPGNAERFARKWGLKITGPELFSQGYDSSAIVDRELPFRTERHYAPLRPAGYRDRVRAASALTVALVAPDYFPLPPPKYGGIERVVYTLTEELARLGHDVYLYAPRGSRANATVIPFEHNGYDMSRIPELMSRTLPAEVEVIHDHTQLSVVGREKPATPTVSSIHNPLYNPVQTPVYLSRRQMDIYGKGEGEFVYNGIELSDYPLQTMKQDYLLYMGAILPYKGVHYALEVAERTGRKLIMAGPTYNMDYYRSEIVPAMQRNPNIQFVGEVGGSERLELFRNAECLLFPTLCEEPFGLVMIEAMACGTPPLCFPNGAVPEVMGGFPELVCRTTGEMTRKVAKAAYPPPEQLRAYVENHFSAAIMAQRYLAIYRRLLAQSRQG